MQWDAVEDKPTVLLYGGGAIVALWLTSVVVGAINAVPLVMIMCLAFCVCWCALRSEFSGLIRRPWCTWLSMQLPKIMELVGLGYTGWFVYRYLLFKVTNVQQPYIFRLQES